MPYQIQCNVCRGGAAFRHGHQFKTVIVHRSRENGRIKVAFLQVFQFRFDQSAEFFQRLSFQRPGGNEKHVFTGEREQTAGDGLYLLRLAQICIKDPVLSVAQNGEDQIPDRTVFFPVNLHGDRHHQELTFRSGHLCCQWFLQRFQGRYRVLCRDFFCRQRAERFPHERNGLFVIQIPHQDQHHIFRHIILMEEVFDIPDGRIFQVFRQPDHRAGEGVFFAGDQFQQGEKSLPVVVVLCPVEFFIHRFQFRVKTAHGNVAEAFPFQCEKGFQHVGGNNRFVCRDFV